MLTYDVDDAARNSDPERDLQLEQKAVLDEVHAMFPQKVHRIAHLFDVGTSRLEALLHRWKQDPVLIRSLFLQRDQFVKESYEDGLCHFYRLMYGEQNAWQGYRIVGDSFLASGFVSQAHVAYSEGLESLARSDLAGPEKESAVSGFQSSIADMQQAMASSSAEQPEEKR